MMIRLFFLAVCLLPSAPAALAQRAATPAPASAAKLSPAFFTTYTYLTYAILDESSGPAPVAARGVGGTLTFSPDGTYQKHLQLTDAGRITRFEQTGRLTFAGDKIMFSYTDKKGASRTDRGTFRLRNNLLTLFIEGFPTGNYSTYTLRAQ